MFTEVSAVQSTVWSIGIIGVSAFLTVLLFTASARTSVSERFRSIPLQYCRFTLELQWQSRGKWRI